LTGCDSRAKASGGGKGEVRSREYETCDATAACAEDLHCFDNVCRRAARSNVGDFFAALGEQYKAKGDLEAAVDAYNKALGHYDSEKIGVPPDVDCAYGATLAAAKQNKEHAELGARVLHRCILAVPVGSPLRDRALVALATLNDAGLDPLALGRTQLADVYLTRAPKGPSLDKLTVTVAPSPPVDKKSFPMVTDRLAQPDLKTALVACWQQYNQATKKTALTVALPVKWGYIPSEYDDEPGKYIFKMDAPAPALAGPDAAADTCARAAVEPALKALTTVRDSFTTKLQITIK
jgi:hypothetical protein